MKDYGSEQRRSGAKSTALPYRSDFEIDKGRIIHSEAFRRLQSKTQVLQVSESDFHRNRLTHSVEVAQIGRGISKYIEHAYKERLAEYNLILDHDLIEAICLAHDIGHPPFGHGGEIALNYMMDGYGGFEGNGQTLRIISRLGKYSQGNGMDLTRRVCLGVLKYPCRFSELWNTSKSRNKVNKFHELNQDEWKAPKCYFDDEKEVVDWILQVFSHQDQTSFKQFRESKEDNHKPKYKSFDCSVMELADDIAYAVHDFEDGFELGLFNEHLINELIERTFSNNKFIWHLEKEREYNDYEILKMKKLSSLKKMVSVWIGFLISSIELIENDIDFECPFLQYKAVLNPEADALLNDLKTIVDVNIIKSFQNQQTVKNGQIIICNLFDVFVANNQLLPENTREKFEMAERPYRVVSDYIAGMTDRYALKMYSKIFGGTPKIL